MLRRPSLALLAALALAAPARADESYCLSPNTGGIDPGATQALQQLLGAPDPQAAQMMAGTWALQTTSPSGQVSNMLQTFEPNGLFSYQDHVCMMGNSGCNDYQGTGLYGVRGNGDGSVFGVVMVSDLNRDHQCTAFNGRFVDAGTFVNGSGQQMRRVR